MRFKHYLLAAILTGAIAIGARAVKAQVFRPPAVPLVTSDPYLSIWSEADELTGDVAKHWTHHPMPVVGLIRIDNKVRRLIGNQPSSVRAMQQTGLKVTATRSIYWFNGAGVSVMLTFMTPALPNDLAALTLPLSYVTWSVHSTDHRQHAVSLYFSASSYLSVNTGDQPIVWKRRKMGQLTSLRMGTAAQTVCVPMGDDVRIDWGYAYVAALSRQCKTAALPNSVALDAWVTTGKLPHHDMRHSPVAPNLNHPVMAFSIPLGNVGVHSVSRTVIVAYDELYNVKFFGKLLRPYWRRNHTTCSSMLQHAYSAYPLLAKKCMRFDAALHNDLVKVGGPKYAQIAETAYRESLAGTGISVDSHGQPLMFTKENTSNGDIATVDVIFPMDPVWVLLSPTLAKASLVPDLLYAASSHWKFPNAPHDIGTYPVAMGRDDGGEGMPVEESGNMLLLCDAIAQDDGNANFVSPWWSKLTQWATYLKQYGLDPENQLCTDDFMGHLAHNANLSVKAILGLAAYGDLCRMRGDSKAAQAFTHLAHVDAAHWVKVADAGSHSLLAFDKPGTWSQKYNMVWDRILGLHIFSNAVQAREIKWYKTVIEPYGVPLDSRTHISKSDWSTWADSMATKKSDFEELFSPIYNYFNNTTTRDPLADSYLANDIHSGGMHARPVVGGFFIRMLTNHKIWHSWSSQDRMQPHGWAPLPPAPVLHTVIPAGNKGTAVWRYTTQKPADNWRSAGFNDSTWATGKAGFGTMGTPSVAVHTNWNTDDIWIRRQITLPRRPLKNLVWYVFHDEDVQIYVNGVLAGEEPGFITDYEAMPIFPQALRLLRPGATVTLAVHCHQTTGGQGIDVGLDEELRAP